MALQNIAARKKKMCELFSQNVWIWKQGFISSHVTGHFLHPLKNKGHGKRPVASNELKKQICQIENPAGIYLFKVNEINTRLRCEVCSNKVNYKDTRTMLCYINFEHILHLPLVFPMLILTM